ncbi:MAG: hypothetical protein FWC45_06785, partial [Treponema sp.]|nr:hypothetical protein [Treponema sp.]
AIKADGSIGGRFTSPSWTTQNGSRPGFGAPWALPAYLLADGTTYPFMVNTVGDLQKVGTQTASGGWTLSAKYKQTADIDLSVITNLMWTPIGNGSQFFNGTYDGAGYTISSLNINNPTLNNQGLFGLLSGTVKNLALTGVDITGGDSTGGIAGESDGTIQNCYVTGSITGKLDTGGIAGYVNLGSVTNCYTTCNVVGSSSQAGGIAGYTRGTIQYCYSTGNITGYTYVGGIAGVVSSNSTSSQPGIVQYCVALNKNVTATGSTTVGRVAGNNSNGTLNNYARPTPQLTSKSTTGLMILTDINGPVYVFSPGNATGINGLDVAAANYNSAGRLKWGPDNGFPSTNWSSTANRLPWLKTDGGSVFRNQSPVVTQ